MRTYRRPEIDAPVFRDAAGEVIDYGNRWSGSPPQGTYSVDTHPERFEPLHTVTEAVIDHLRVTFDVETSVAEVTADPVNPRIETLQSVRLVPADPRCAPLGFVFTAYPGIVVHAGLLHSFAYPPCGCDACDESWERQAAELEADVLAVVAGDYQESVRLGHEPWVGYSITTPDGGRSSSVLVEEDLDRLVAAEPVLRELGGPWAPWPQRH